MGTMIVGIIVALVGFLVMILNFSTFSITSFGEDSFSPFVFRHAIGGGIMYVGVAIFLIGLVLKIF